MKSELLSKHRGEILGVATLSILIVHSTFVFTGSDTVSKLMLKLFGFGGIGVCAFVLASAMGLYFSLSNASQKDTNWKSITLRFYKKRAIRIFIPYLIIAGIWYFAEYIIVSFSPLDFIFRITTVGYWLGKGGIWFICMLIPLYLVYPFYFRWVEKGSRFVKTVVVVSVLFAVTALVSILFYPVYTKFMQVFNSYIIFAISHYIGYMVKEKKKLPIWFILFTIFFYPVRAFIPFINKIELLGNLGYAFLGVGLTFVVAWVFDYIKIPVINKILCSLGAISLESYLFNHFFVRMLNEILPNMWVEINAFIRAFLIIALGLAFSYLYSWISAMIRAELERKRSCKKFPAGG